MDKIEHSLDIRFIKNNPSPIIIVDLEGRLTYLNRATEKLLRSTELEKAEFGQLLAPNFVEILTNCIAAGVDIPATRIEYTEKTFLWISIYSDTKQEILYQGIDITRMHRNEQALLAAKEKAEEGEKLKAAFLDNMSHEIRTPLNSLLGFINLIGDELQDTLNADQQFYFELIQQNGNRLERTMSEILDISNFSSGTYHCQKQTIDAVSLVKQVIDERLKDASAKGITVELHFPEVELLVEVDKYCLVQAVSHLIDNAIKYTDEGQVFIAVNDERGQVEIRIEDTGPGLDDEMQRCIFVAFNQGSSGHTKQFQGIGLGLSLVRVYLDAIGAAIDLDSELGEGSRFTICLPLKDSEH